MAAVKEKGKIIWQIKQDQDENFNQMKEEMIGFRNQAI